MGAGLLGCNAGHHQGASVRLFLPGGEASLGRGGEQRLEVQPLRVGQLEVKLGSGQRQRQNLPGEEKLHVRS